MEKGHNYFMSRAIELAAENAGSVTGGPFGAVIVKDGEIVAAQSNKVTVDIDPTAHAEVNAIREACKVLGTFDLSGCILYSSCEPCPMCLSAAYWAHIDKIYYAADRYDAAKVGFDDEFIYKELSLPISARRLGLEQIMPEDGLVPFVKWSENNEKIHY
ncbi:MAG: nucleoside deaminase [Bacteroidales bacterium]|nr:nucleoside deaminase [Bacteroidales bacterium]MBQ5882046.1 nucleoside deaminase [Bacteroidales bacterium]